MYEYHGWITLRVSFENKEEENADRKLIETINQIKKHVDKISLGYGLLDIRPINAVFHLCTSGNHNHRPIGQYSPVTLFTYIAAIAPGSYGILYIIDDEDMRDENYNKFKVYVLKKGTVEECCDPFLSPFTPTVENFSSD